jgi:hypothetical protein
LDEKRVVAAVAIVQAFEVVWGEPGRVGTVAITHKTT